MKIENNKFVTVTYVLKVDDEIIEVVQKEKPMSFIFGQGYLLPKFEEYLKDKTTGDTFAFELKACDAYGEIEDDAFIELQKNMFAVDGEIDESLFTIGNVIPMRDSKGNRLNGTVESVSDDVIVMNFNHPLAGCNLNFTGEIIDVRDITAEELAKMQSSCSSKCHECHSNCNV